jgi:menaquinone-specific isochorismate synthase
LCFEKNRILRFEAEINSLDFLNWLAQIQNDTKIYWSNRKGDFEIAGYGLAYALYGTSLIDYEAVYHELKKYLTQNPNLKFFGGFAFNQKSVDKSWESFGCYRFILPRFELIRLADKTFFACNIFADTLTEKSLNEILRELESIKLFSPESNYKFPQVISRRDTPLKLRWLKEVAKILKQIDRGFLGKVVLARKSIFEFKDDLNAPLFLKKLKNLSPHCFHFCVQFEGKNCFLGASPERFYRREGRLIKTEALAGTRPRGISPKQDEYFRNELMSSKKERQEHEFVAHSIEETLKQICRTCQKKVLNNFGASTSRQKSVKEAMQYVRNVLFDIYRLGVITENELGVRMK